jgi:hypothetical protein
MVDIRIRGLHAPLPGIVRKIGFHVFVDELLKIDIELPKRSDEDVCATTSMDRDISPRVFQSHVGGVVRGRDADLVSGRSNEDKNFFVWECGGS